MSRLPFGFAAFSSGQKLDPAGSADLTGAGPRTRLLEGLEQFS
jgi:hypothetical protein